MPTVIRNGWKRGDYLMVDDISGFTEWRSNMVRRYDGIMMKRSGNQDEIGRHPQEFVRAKPDPRPLTEIRLLTDTTAYDPALDVPENTISSGAASHLYNFRIEEPSGGMEIAPDGISMASARACARFFVVT